MIEQEHTPFTLEKLTDLITAEIYKAFSIQANSRIGRFFHPLFRIPAVRFSRIGMQFDEIVADKGIAAGANWALPNFIKGFLSFGEEKVPQEGPLLVVSNHPGVADSLVLTAALQREDLKIVAGGIPFIMNLPHASQHIIFATDDIHMRMNTCRSAIRHLEDGGSVLIFPSGKIDPDPAVMPGAPESIDRWSKSIELFLRKVPEAKLLVAIVSSVLAGRYVYHPLTRLRQTVIDRQRVAEFLQVMQHLILKKKADLLAHVSFANPVTVPELQLISRLESILESIKANARAQLEVHQNLPFHGQGV
jgi:1-acyl-sn-glycerol-3-phosphate acyltransferase